MKVFLQSMVCKVEYVLVAEDAVKERSFRRRLITCTFLSAAYTSILLMLLK
jgi:hypothetical protein